MQNLRLIKSRIKSAKNISQITKAMELVSASKMKKAQAAAESGKLYAEMIREMVMRLGGRVSVSAHPLLAKPKKITGTRCIVLISTNKGLCGGLNSTLFRFVNGHYQQLKNNRFVVLGQKGVGFVAGMGGNIIADFSSQGAFTALVPAVTTLSIQEFLSGTVDGVDLVYNQFISVLKQQPRVKQILPITIDAVATSDTTEEKGPEFTIEPGPEEVFETLLPHYVENQIRDAMLQAEASEHAARMVAMRNATDNAKSFISDLTLVYNKARQEKITYEISDMVTARAAIMKD